MRSTVVVAGPVRSPFGGALGIPTHRLLRPLLPAMALLAAFGLGPPAGAQVLDVDDEPEAQAPAQPEFFLSEENFDIWVFGNTRSGPAARTRLETQLKLQVDEVDRVARLSAAQRKTLELAGRGDIKRFFDRVEQKRKEFQLVRNDQQKFSDFYQELRTLQLVFNGGLIGDGSFFAKALKKTLAGEQSAAYGAVVRERESIRQQFRVGQVLATLDNAVGLKADQRQRLLELMTNETRPPKKSGQYDQYVVLLQLARLPEDRLKPIFNDAQWRLFSQHLDRARGLETFLSGQDLLPDEPAREPRAVPAVPKSQKPAPDATKPDPRPGTSP
jgi:hypothetical protein